MRLFPWSLLFLFCSLATVSSQDNSTSPIDQEIPNELTIIPEETTPVENKGEETTSSVPDSVTKEAIVVDSSEGNESTIKETSTTTESPPSTTAIKGVATTTRSISTSTEGSLNSTSEIKQPVENINLITEAPQSMEVTMTDSTVLSTTAVPTTTPENMTFVLGETLPTTLPTTTKDPSKAPRPLSSEDYLFEEEPIDFVLELEKQLEEGITLTPFIRHVIDRLFKISPNGPFAGKSVLFSLMNSVGILSTKQQALQDLRDFANAYNLVIATLKSKESEQYSIRDTFYFIENVLTPGVIDSLLLCNESAGIEEKLRKQYGYYNYEELNIVHRDIKETPLYVDLLNRTSCLVLPLFDKLIDTIRLANFSDPKVNKTLLQFVGNLGDLSPLESLASDVSYQRHGKYHVPLLYVNDYFNISNSFKYFLYKQLISFNFTVNDTLNAFHENVQNKVEADLGLIQSYHILTKRWRRAVEEAAPLAGDINNFSLREIQPIVLKFFPGSYDFFNQTVDAIMSTYGHLNLEKAGIVGWDWLVFTFLERRFYHRFVDQNPLDELRFLLGESDLTKEKKLSAEEAIRQMLKKEFVSRQYLHASAILYDMTNDLISYKQKIEIFQNDPLLDKSEDAGLFYLFAQLVYFTSLDSYLKNIVSPLGLKVFYDSKRLRMTKDRNHVSERYDKEFLILEEYIDREMRIDFPFLTSFMDKEIHSFDGEYLWNNYAVLTPSYHMPLFSTPFPIKSSTVSHEEVLPLKEVAIKMIESLWKTIRVTPLDGLKVWGIYDLLQIYGGALTKVLEESHRVDQSFDVDFANKSAVDQFIEDVDRFSQGIHVLANQLDNIVHYKIPLEKDDEELLRSKFAKIVTAWKAKVVAHVGKPLPLHSIFPVWSIQLKEKAAYLKKQLELYSIRRLYPFFYFSKFESSCPSKDSFEAFLEHFHGDQNSHKTWSHGLKTEQLHSSWI